MAAQFDYIIVGGGSAGCVLAARLSEDERASVLLLEAGGPDRSRLFSIPAGFAKMTRGIASWGWSTVPQRHMQDRVLWYTQANVLGGGSTINAQIYTRGHRDDYDGWVRDFDCQGWSYADVLPYFRRSEDNQSFLNAYHGAGGPLGVSQPTALLPVTYAFVRAAQSWGMPFNADFNGAEQAGCGFYQLTQRDACRSSTARDFLLPASGRRNLTVRTDVPVTRIVLEGQRVVGVEVIENGRPAVLQANEETIVSCGAIGSPRLLMLSGIGPPDHLKSVGIRPLHDLPGVGENLHDHLDLFVISECTGRHSYDHFAKPFHAARAGLQYMTLKSGPAASSLFETGAFWYSDEEQSRPDLQFHFGQGSGIEAGVAAMKQGGVTLNVAYMRPKSRGTVRLKSSDPKDAPLIDPNYWAEPEDRRRHFAGLAMAREIMRHSQLEPFLKAERLPSSSVQREEALFRYGCENAKTQHHPVGTCRMGRDELAVVDPTLKVHGLEGLRVCDSSVMPRINSSNTNAPTIMIAEKGADLIRGRSLLGRRPQ